MEESLVKVVVSGGNMFVGEFIPETRIIKTPRLMFMPPGGQLIWTAGPLKISPRLCLRRMTDLLGMRIEGGAEDIGIKGVQAEGGEVGEVTKEQIQKRIDLKKEFIKMTEREIEALEMVLREKGE